MRPLRLGLVCTLLWCGACASKGKDAAKQHVEAAQPVAAQLVPDAALPMPKKEQAVQVVQRFASALMAKKLTDARAEMHVPESLSDKQIAFFLRELANGEHLCAAGLAAVLEKDLAPLATSFGDKAAAVAQGAQLSLDEAFVLGDLQSAVVMQWDGTRFWIVALHELGPEG